MYTIKFNDTEIGNSYDMTLLITRIEQRSTKKGDPYVRLTLSDGTSECDANLFNNTTRDSMIENGLAEESAANLKVKCTEFNGLKNYTIETITPCELTDDEKALLVRMPPIAPKKLLINIIQSVKASSGRFYDMQSGEAPADDFSLTALCLRLIWENRANFYKSSAAKTMHHNLYGGLVYHTYRMVLCANSICDTYKSLNKELLICGTALHDIGKIKELDTTGLGAASYTTDGRLFGHALIGIEMIDAEVSRADLQAGHETYNREEVRLLKHLIASHHGTLEWGAITVPAIPEAMILHNIDMIDSRMYMYEEGLSNIEAGTLSEPIYGIAEDGKATIYKPSI